MRTLSSIDIEAMIMPKRQDEIEARRNVAVLNREHKQMTNEEKNEEERNIEDSNKY